jgi:membrane fusion protein (multidrug efflux system)
MPATFSRTLRFLEADRSRRRGLGILLVALLAGWVVWFLFGHVPVYEVTTKARLEVTSAAHPVAARVAGQVAWTRLTIGHDVQAGDVLMVLDSQTDHLALVEKRTRCAALRDRLSALRKEIEGERKSLEVLRAARDVALDEARAQLAEAEAKADYADRRAETLKRLRASSAVSELEYNESKAQAIASRATVRAVGLAASRIEKDRSVQENERLTRLAKLDREAVEFDGEIAIEEAAIRRLEHAIELRSIRAPVSGRVGEAAEVHVGGVIYAGERLGAIVPAGESRVVAWFPAAAVGRIRPEQPARLRLDGFPWTQYGTLAATVTDVGNEGNNGVVRVELTIPANLATTIPLQHGLPGSAEVEVERVSPAMLVLRAAGQLLHVERPSRTDGDDATEP